PGTRLVGVWLLLGSALLDPARLSPYGSGAQPRPAAVLPDPADAGAGTAGVLAHLVVHPTTDRGADAQQPHRIPRGERGCGGHPRRGERGVRQAAAAPAAEEHDIPRTGPGAAQLHHRTGDPDEPQPEI